MQLIKKSQSALYTIMRFACCLVLANYALELLKNVPIFYIDHENKKCMDVPTFEFHFLNVESFQPILI